MSEAASSLEQVYIVGLRDAYAMETQAIELISRQLDRLKNYPAMESRLRRHLEESETQRERLKGLLAEQQETPSSLKSLAMGLVGNLAALGHAPAADEVIKNTMANFAFEHYEIAAYKSLRALAEARGDAQAVSALEASLAEEQAMASWIDGQIAPTSLEFVNRKQMGLKADR